MVKIIFSQRNQYHAQIFVYMKCHLCARYVHDCNCARNLWRLEADYPMEAFEWGLSAVQIWCFYNQWQNIMGILKIMVKNPSSPLYNVGNP